MAKKKSRFSALTKYAVEQEAKKDPAKELAELIVFAIEGYTEKNTLMQIIYNQLVAAGVK